MAILIVDEFINVDKCEEYAQNVSIIISSKIQDN